MIDSTQPDRQNGDGLSREQITEYIRELNTIAAECEIAGTAELSRAAHNLYRIAKQWFKSLPARDAAEGAGTGTEQDIDAVTGTADDQGLFAQWENEWPHKPDGWGDSEARVRLLEIVKSAPPKPAPDFEAAALALGFVEENGKWFPTTSSPDRNTSQSWESAEQIFEWWGRASGNVEPAPDAMQQEGTLFGQAFKTVEMLRSDVEFDRPYREFLATQLEAAFSAPVPDAMREAQIRRNYADSATHAAIATACEVACAGGSAQDVVKALRERFSAPVPPADAMVDREALIAKYRAIHSKEAQFIALCIEAWQPVPPANAMRTALEVAQVALQNIEPATLGDADICKVAIAKIDWALSQAHVPPADGARGLYFEPSGDGMGACIHDANGAIICEAKYADFESDPSYPERVMRLLIEPLNDALAKEREACALIVERWLDDTGLRRAATDAIRNRSPSGTGAAEPSFALLEQALGEIEFYCSRHGKQPLETVIEFIERLATPPVRGDRETAREIVTEWLGMFDPPPQIDFQQSEFLQGAIASALAIPRTALPVQPSAGERDWQWLPIETRPLLSGKYLVGHRGRHQEIMHFFGPEKEWGRGTQLGWQRLTDKGWQPDDPAMRFNATHCCLIEMPASRQAPPSSSEGRR